MTNLIPWFERLEKIKFFSSELSNKHKHAKTIACGLWSLGDLPQHIIEIMIVLSLLASSHTPPNVLSSTFTQLL